jgi:hypothetical protein
MWCQYYVLMSKNWKMRLDEAVPQMGERGIKENDGGVEFNNDML